MTFSTNILPMSPKSVARLSMPQIHKKMPVTNVILTHIIAFTFGACLTISLYSFSYLMPHRNKSSTQISSELHNTDQAQCDFELVFNKPPKTAGTFIQTLITEWATRTGRPNILCHGRRAVETAVYLQECLPYNDNTRCSVLNAHLLLTPAVRSLLSTRIPNHRILTSTRYPAHRIVSFFLQLNLAKASSNSTTEADLHSFLRGFNPWDLYNFHSGEKRRGSCPLRRDDVIDIFQLAGRFDLVVDANLPEESNIILEHFNLFRFPTGNKQPRVNVRGAGNMKISETTKSLIREVSCVENEIHRAMHLRMASLYEKITGKDCIKSGRLPDITSCLDEREKVYLKSQWTV